MHGREPRLEGPGFAGEGKAAEGVDLTDLERCGAARERKRAFGGNQDRGRGRHIARLTEREPTESIKAEHAVYSSVVIRSPLSAGTSGMVGATTSDFTREDRRKTPP